MHVDENGGIRRENSNKGINEHIPDEEIRVARKGKESAQFNGQDPKPLKEFMVELAQKEMQINGHVEGREQIGNLTGWNVAGEKEKKKNPLG